MKWMMALLLLVATLFGKEMTIESEDGFQLFGWLEYPEQKSNTYPLAFFAHQFAADHTIWNELAADLRQKGYATLMVDLRGHGKSVMQKGKKNEVVADVTLEHIGAAFKQSAEKVGFEQIPADLGLWLDRAGEVENLNMDKLVFFGSSLGGGAIIPLMVDYEPVAVVSISPGGGQEEAIKTSLNYSESQSLFIAGKNDPLGAQERALKYANEALRGTYLMISSDGHGTVLLPGVHGYVMNFLDKNVQ